MAHCERRERQPRKMTFPAAEPEESAILRVLVDVQAYDVEGFYYGEGDRGRSCKVIHHFLPLPFVDSLAYVRPFLRSFLQTRRWSRPGRVLSWSLVHSRVRFFEGQRRSCFEVASIAPRFLDNATFLKRVITRWFLTLYDLACTYLRSFDDRTKR